jgi:hypothetical protein
MTKDNDESLEYRVDFEEFAPLRASGATHEEKVLHALEYIADAVGILAKAQFYQHGIGRGGDGGA